MKKSFLISIIGFFVLFVAVILISLWVINKNVKSIAYVDNVRLFNEFAMKKELERDFNKLEMTSKARLDSLKIQIEILGRKIESEKSSNEIRERFDFMRRDYLMKEEQMRLSSENSAKKFNEQIWGQLNTYVKQFAKNNDYEIILGTSGEGNLMYASDDMDITGKALDYVNEKYKGK